MADEGIQALRMVVPAAVLGGTAVHDVAVSFKFRPATVSDHFFVVELCAVAATSNRVVVFASTLAAPSARPYPAGKRTFRQLEASAAHDSELQLRGRWPDRPGSDVEIFARVVVLFGEGGEDPLADMVSPGPYSTLYVAALRRTAAPQRGCQAESDHVVITVL